MKILSLPLLVACCALPYIVSAIEIRFTSLELALDDLYFKDGHEKIYVFASYGSLSAPFKYDDTSLKLYREVQNEDGELEEQLVVRQKLPKDKPYLIAVLIKKARNDDVLCIFLDDSPLVRPLTSVTTLNLSGHQLALRLDSHDYILNPGDSDVTLVGAERPRFLVNVAAQEDGEWKLVFSNPIAMRPGLRSLILFRNWRPSPGARDTVVEFVSFYDTPQFLATTTP